MIGQIESCIHSLSVIDKSLRDLHRTQRIEQKDPRMASRLYRLSNERDIFNREVFGYQKGDVVRIRLSGHGGLTELFVVMSTNGDNVTIHHPRWDYASENWLVIKTIKRSEILLFEGHSFEKDKVKEK